MKKKLLSSAPWRGEEEKAEEFKDAKLKVTNQPGSTPTMYVPAKKSASSKLDDTKESIAEIDPELRYSFQRNFMFLQRVFSIDTIVKPLPPALAYNVSRNLSFFTRIFTQFFDPSLLPWLLASRGVSLIDYKLAVNDAEGISNAQKSLGLGHEEKVRRVR